MDVFIPAAAISRILLPDPASNCSHSISLLPGVLTGFGENHSAPTWSTVPAGAVPAGAVSGVLRSGVLSSEVGSGFTERLLVRAVWTRASHVRALPARGRRPDPPRDGGAAVPPRLPHGPGSVAAAARPLVRRR